MDRDDNGNNRFEVAGDLNRRVSGVCHPFWGCPQSCESDTMSCTKSGSGHLAEKRLTDVGNMQPIWKLYGNGSVGSQALLGIPHLTRVAQRRGTCASFSCVAVRDWAERVT